jgi:hypothetical protein
MFLLSLVLYEENILLFICYCFSGVYISLAF